tara:strand:- start:664 stop:903 length:240 start_codon:yes stop_codon:yes gene_type:complete
MLLGSLTLRRFIMPVYEVLVVEKPTIREKEDGKLEKLVFGPEITIASDEQAAALTALTDNDKVNAADKSKIDILVRPFA